MKNNSDIHCDLLVIGAGLAGMVATARAASLGLSTVQAGSSSGFYLTSGLLDFLGVYPVDTANVLNTPYDGLDKLKKDIPHHPYAKIAVDSVVESFDFVDQVLASAGLEYQGSENINLRILTAAGTFKPSFFVPKTMIKGCSVFKKEKRLLLVDFNGLKGYSAKQIASVLKKQNMDVSTLTIDVPQLSGDFNVTRLARLFEDPLFIETIAEQMKPFAKDKDLIGLPSVCGIFNSADIMETLEKLIGADCFEIPGLPPSIPGLRLKNAFEKALSWNNVTVLNNSTIEFCEFKNKEIILDAVYENTRTRIKAKGVILATGRFPGGGLRAQRGLIEETIFNIPVYHPRQRSLWYQSDLFAPQGHPINQAGILTDQSFRPVDEMDVPIFESLYAAGSMLAHNDWVRLKSGAGVSCASAFCAVNHFYAKQGDKNE